MFKLFFLTSSKTKLAHLDYLFRDYDVEILPPPDYGRPYIEPRIYDRKQLLEESINDANQRLARNKSILKEHGEKKSYSFEMDFGDGEISKALASDHQHKIFFIEDTSVVIDALSVAEEVPGVDIKYWMREHDFSSLDQMLRERGNLRTASVRSDIVLYLPPGLRETELDIYKVFTGRTFGSVVDCESEFEINPLYPWLDNKTFNRWFVPEGASDVISKLPVETSIQYDFRHRAVAGMLEFLEKKQLIRKKNKLAPSQSQLELFPALDYIFCGPTCSGKTVLAYALSLKYAYRHIEASDFMRKIFTERHGFNNGVDIHEFAKKMLSSDPGVVANQVADYILSNDLTRFIVTGFRSPEEIDLLCQRLNRSDIKVIYIDASVLVRYERSVARGRADKAESYERFLEQNRLQESMGLLSIKDRSSFIANEGSIFSYFKKAVKSLVPVKSCLGGVKFSLIASQSFLQLENIFLVVLFYEEQAGTVPLTTAEIAKVIAQKFMGLRVRDGVEVPINKNNVSRFFNQRVNIHFKAVLGEKVVRYRLSQTGKSAALEVIRAISVQ